MKTADEIRTEVRRRLGIVKDSLIGQSPEDLPRHYQLIGRQSALKSLLEFIGEDGPTTDPITAMVITNEKPKYLITDNEEWDTLLGQFRNCEKVKVSIIRTEGQQ